MLPFTDVFSSVSEDSLDFNSSAQFLTDRKGVGFKEFSSQ